MLEIRMGLTKWIEVAKSWTAEYAKTHKGRNKLEKECIKKGYLIKRLGEIIPDCHNDEKNKLGIFALDKHNKSNKIKFTYIR